MSSFLKSVQVILFLSCLNLCNIIISLLLKSSLFFFHGSSLLKLSFHFSECYLKEFHQYFSSFLLLEFHFQCLPFLIYFLFLVGLIHFNDLRKHVYVALCLHPRFLSLSPEWSTQLLIHLHLISHGYLPLKIQRCSPLNSSSLWVYRKDLQ